MPGTIVVALGGNAVAPPRARRLRAATAPPLRKPTKPRGPALATVGPARLRARGVPVVEERPGRWRRLAPSPRPVAIVEREMVRHLVSAGHIVVACGGGGPPVDDDPKLGLEGIDAVADKDLVAAILGRDIGADVLLILTNVDAVFRARSEEHTSELQSRLHLVCRLLLEKKKH